MVNPIKKKLAHRLNPSKHGHPIAILISNYLKQMAKVIKIYVEQKK